MIPRVEPEGMLFRKPVSTFRDHARGRGFPCVRRGPLRATRMGCRRGACVPRPLSSPTRLFLGFPFFPHGPYSFGLCRRPPGWETGGTGTRLVLDRRGGRRVEGGGAEPEAPASR